MTKLLIVLTALFISMHSNAQDGRRLNDIKGYRAKQNRTPIIYLNNTNDNTIRFNRTRTLDWTPYFAFVTSQPETTVNGKTYQMIIFPGDRWDFSVGTQTSWDDESRNMNLISKNDWGRTFWIDKDELQNIDTAYHRYRQDVILGAMTLPFKYRPERGDKSSSYVDGSFNIGPFVGYKIRLSEDRPFFIAPVISGGITSITYNSANNSQITDPDKTETGFGFQYCGGVVLDFYKVQMGLIFGSDHGTGDISKTFDYQDALWLGVSLNFNFLAYKADEKDNKNK